MKGSQEGKIQERAARENGETADRTTLPGEQHQACGVRRAWHQARAPTPGPTGGAQDGGWLPPTPLHPGRPPCSSVRFHQLSQITPLLKHFRNTPAASHQPRQTLWAPQQGHATSPPSGLEHTESPAHVGPSTARTRVPLPPSPHLQALGQSPPPRDLPTRHPRCHGEVEAERVVSLEDSTGFKGCVGKPKLACREDPEDEPWGSGV